MTPLFIDAVFLIALVNQRDDAYEESHRLAQTHRTTQRITSEPVLTELLDYFCERGPYFRAAALALMDDIRSDPMATVIPQTPELFAAGLDLYRRRPDKGFSLTDCMSMAICTAQSIKQVLTHDRHFAQEGFEVLL